MAAGQGKRMRSSCPKVLQEIGGKPLLFHVLTRIHETSPHAPIAVVIGHGREQVESYIQNESSLKGLNIHFIIQSEQKGTGHAVRCAMDSPFGRDLMGKNAGVLVLPGDVPLITGRLIQEMMTPLRPSEVLRLMTGQFSNPTGYGRVVRKGKNGPVLRIVEERDANPKEKRIREVALSIYSFRADFLKKSVGQLTQKNAQGEYYLTDVIALASKAKKKVSVLPWETVEDVKGVNDPWELAEANRQIQERTLKKWARLGVKWVDPWSCQVDVEVELEEGVVVHPGTILNGKTRVGAGSVLGPHAVLRDVEIGKNVVIKAGTVAEKSKIESNSQLGPYAHLRPESVVGPSVKIGNFVELKKTRVGAHSSIAHLSYLGDAEVGERVNIGCGFVTCNYDGRVIRGERKHKTIIEDDAFIGSDCQAVAPVKIGRGAYVASGSTITEDVEAESLAIARARQTNKPGYAKKYGRRT